MNTKVKSADYVLEANRLIQLALDTQPESAKGASRKILEDGGHAILVTGDAPFVLVRGNDFPGYVVEIRPSPKSIKRHHDRLRRGEWLPEVGMSPTRDPRQNN